MNEAFEVYEIATGKVRWRGEGPEGCTEQQKLPEGLAARKVVPQPAS